MPGAWDVSDWTLDKILNQFREWLTDSGSLYVGLFINDYVPVPGTVRGDLVEADFPGYEWALVQQSEWGTVTVEDHVAIIENEERAVFVADDEEFDPMDIYGYFIFENFEGTLRWVERFATKKTMEPEGELSIKLKFRVRTYPAPD